ncbi:MAG: thioredoxin domain-containing protein [Anaeromyxobacter sp.]|nr:thioredoxin domain-containing protein [Anaeromyxobacter sp.]
MTRKAQAASPPPAATPRLAFLAALLLSLGGLVVALVLVRLHEQAHAGLSSFCAISETMNCDKVAMSPFSVVLRLPVAVWGALGYGLAAALAGWGLTPRRLHPGWPAGLLLLVAAAAVGASVALALISKLLIGAWCVLCMASWSIALLLLVAAWAACPPAGPLAAVRADLAALGLAPRRASAVAVLGLAAIALLASLYPRYWERPRVPALLAAPAAAPAGAPAVPTLPPGSRDPAAGAIVYSDYECPYCAVSHADLKVVLSHRPDIRVVKRHFPLDVACNPVVKRPMHQDACAYARAAICAEAQGKLGPMDDALFENRHGKRPVETLAAEQGLDLAAFRACLASPETERRLQGDIASAIADGIKATPTYLVGGVQYAGRLPVEVFKPAAP